MMKDIDGAGMFSSRWLSQGCLASLVAISFVWKEQVWSEIKQAR
jgi:hypothetical protein